MLHSKIRKNSTLKQNRWCRRNRREHDQMLERINTQAASINSPMTQLYRTRTTRLSSFTKQWMFSMLIVDWSHSSGEMFCTLVFVLCVQTERDTFFTLINSMVSVCDDVQISRDHFRWAWARKRRWKLTNGHMCEREEYDDQWRMSNCHHTKGLFGCGDGRLYFFVNEKLLLSTYWTSRF